MPFSLQVSPIYLINHYIKIIAQKNHFYKIRQQKIENLRIYEKYVYFFILFDVLKLCIVTPQKTIWCVSRQLIKSKRGPSPCIKTEERYMKPFPFLAWHHFFWSATTHSEQKSESIPRMAVCHTFFSQWYYYSARRVVSHDLLASHSILKQKFQYYYVLFLKVVIYLVLL